MRVETYQRHDGEWETHVFLSRRNLETLLAKLDGAPGNSACTISAPSMYPKTLVTAEENNPHYAHESRDSVAPGVMHHETEARLACVG